MVKKRTLSQDKRKPGSKGFSSLVAALKDHFDKQLAQLPGELQDRIVKDLWPMDTVWDKVTAGQRRDLAEQWDYQHDPETEDERQQQWDLLVRCDEIQREITQIESRNWTDFTDRREQLAQLQDARGRLAKAERDLANFEQSMGSHGRGAGSTPVSAATIKARFVVPNVTHNGRWWDQRMRDAKRYGLAGSRASKGTGKRPSLWYPHRVAGWLVDKQHMTEKQVAAILRRNFPDCADTADLLDPPSGG